MKNKSKSFHKKSTSKHKKQVTKTTEEDNKENTNRKVLIDKQALSRMSEQQLLTFLKQTYLKITIQPEQNIKYIENLFIISKLNNVKVVCRALLTLSETFINLAPLEPINLKELNQRMEVKITKQQYKILKFEKLLLQEYQKFIKMLNELNTKVKKENFENNMEVFKQFKKCILNCTCKCFENLWHFNYAKDVCDLLVKFIKYDDCQNCLTNFLSDKNISTLETKAKVVASLSNIIAKKSERELPDNIIKIINATYIDHRYLQKDKQTLDYKKKQLKKKLYWQQAFDRKKNKEKQEQSGTLEMKRKKKHQKALQKLKVKQQVDKEFAEAQAVLSNKLLMKHTSAILQELFYVYFKILVNRQNSTFLRDCLDGILTFAQMINIQLISSLVDHLAVASQQYRLLWKQSKSIQLLQIRLLIIFTAESVINGPLSVYNMDDLNQTKNLYKIFKDINADKKMKINRQIFRLIVLTLQEAFVKKRQLSQQTTASFVKEIAILAARQTIPKFIFLDLIRLLAFKYSKIARMLQVDNEGYGFNSYNPVCQDPQCSNAINTSIIEQLDMIQKSASKSQQNQVKRMIQLLKKQSFLSAAKERQSFQDLFKQDLSYFS